MITKPQLEDGIVQQQLRHLATTMAGFFEAAMTAYDDARSDGLCHDGAWECALAALRGFDPGAVVADPHSTTSGGARSKS